MSNLFANRVVPSANLRDNTYPIPTSIRTKSLTIYGVLRIICLYEKSFRYIGFEGNRSGYKKGNVIVLYLAHFQDICCLCAKYRTITFSLLIRPLPLWPSNPIYHQLSHRECFQFFHMDICLYHSHTKNVQYLKVPKSSSQDPKPQALFNCTHQMYTALPHLHPLPQFRPHPLISFPSPP